MPESVFTHTMPLLLAGGVCCWAVEVDLGVEADLVGAAEELAEELDELAGALEGAGAGAGADLEVELALDEPPALEAGADELEAEPDAFCPPGKTREAGA